MSETPNTVQTPPRTTAQKIIAVSYFAGGVIGMIGTLYQLSGASFGLLAPFAWLFLLVQIAVAIYGAWQFWNHKPIGVQLLYWLSWSCVPVISLSAFTYWCEIGFAVFPTLTLGPGNFGANISARFGYASLLLLDAGSPDLVIGVNAVALCFVFLLARFMRQAGISKWPLIWPKS